MRQWGEDNWEVDIQAPDKVLTIASEKNINPAEVVKSIEGTGYKAEKLG